jgi:hypothetical protein
MRTAKELRMVEVVWDAARKLKIEDLKVGDLRSNFTSHLLTPSIRHPRTKIHRPMKHHIANKQRSPANEAPDPRIQRGTQQGRKERVDQHLTDKQIQKQRQAAAMTT